MQRDTVPYELNEREIGKRDNTNSEMVVYGYLPMMVSAQCVQKNLNGCNHSYSLVPVSYTHLDVYKRQEDAQSGENVGRISEISAEIPL